MKHYKSALLCAVSALCLTTFANAQSSLAGAKAADGVVEEIVVVGRKPLSDSVAAALAVQRSSDSIVSVLSADSVGNMPDQNVAFAIGRLPGVAVQRDQGQARYVNLRGAPVYWTTLSFDGISVVSPQGRDSRFDNIPSAIASQIIVEKAITPNMVGASVAGNVDIRTRRAFDYKGQTITGKLGLGHVELGDGQEKDGVLVYSNIFAGGKLGIVAQASYYTREMATDNWETDPYLSNTTDPTKRFAREHENKHYRLTRENISGSFRADYILNDSNSLFLSTIYTQYHDDELRDNFIFRLDQGTDGNGKSYTSADYINASSPTLGTSFGARINARIDYRDSVEEMSTTTIGGEHRFAKWDGSWRVNYTDTSDGRDTPVTAAFQSPSSFLLRPTVDFDLRNGDVNTVRLYQTVGTTSARAKGAQVTNIETFQFPMTSIGNLYGGDITQAWTLKFDLSRDFNFGGRSSRFAFGGNYTDRQKKSRERSFTKSYSTGNPTWGQFAADLDYLGSQNLQYTFRYTNKDYTTAFMNSLEAAGDGVLNDTRLNYYQVSEEILAGYAMATTDFNWGNIVYGARVEQVKNTGQAYVAFPAVGSVKADTRLVNTSSDDVLVYPSAHFNWNISETVKGRLGLTTSASRPDFDDLRPSFTISDSTQSVSGGNPDAKPEQQQGIDAYIEWYMTPTGFMSAGVFYKNINDVLVKRSSLFNQTVLNLPGLDRSGYVYTAVGNGGDGHLQGLELAFVGTIEQFARANEWPAWTEGFGVNLSATFTSSEVNLPSVNGVPARKIALLGSSDGVYNAQATYEKYGLSVRLAYQYRTPWGESVGDYRVINGGVYPVDNGDIFWDADEELDLSIRYQINEKLEAYFDGVNLTNQGSRRFGDKSANPIEFEKFDKRFIGGVRFKF